MAWRLRCSPVEKTPQMQEWACSILLDRYIFASGKSFRDRRAVSTGLGARLEGSSGKTRRSSICHPYREVGQFRPRATCHTWDCKFQTVVCVLLKDVVCQGADPMCGFRIHLLRDRIYGDADGHPHVH
jgi:hypothetical protein